MDEPTIRSLHSPVRALLGITIDRIDDGLVRLSAPIHAHFTQETGVVQGGILSAVADQAAGICALTLLAPGELTAGIEFKVNFLSAARFPGTLEATARVKKRGGKIAVIEAELQSGGEIVLTGLFTFLIWRPDKMQVL